jgi:hypothetical protein
VPSSSRPRGQGFCWCRQTYSTYISYIQIASDSTEIRRQSDQVEGLSWQEKAIDEDMPKESRGGKEGAKGGRVDGRWRRSSIN